MAAPMSDISGYRADHGTLGQDQGLSDQLKRIITAKGPLLGAPGTVIENDLYYDVASSVVHPVEVQATFAKDRISFNNNVIGSSPSVYIPSVYFAGNAFWMVTLPDANWPASVGSTTTFVAPHGWGFNCLDSIVVYMGASSIAQIQISGVTNFMVNLATCETYEKKLAMITGAGYYLKPHDPNSIMAKPANSANLWRAKFFGSYYDASISTTGVFPSMRQAVVPLRLPWTSMSVLEKRLSLDTKLSTQPIQVTINTKPLSSCFYVTNDISFPTTWASSTLQLWQEELSDKSLSVRNELLAMPMFNVAYPFQYLQSIPFNVLGPDNYTSDQSFTMNLTSIINADLTTMLFMVRWEGTGNNVSRCESAGQFCPLYGELLTDFTLLLNGQRFFGFDNNCYEFVSLAKQMADVTYPVTMPCGKSTTTTSTISSNVNSIVAMNNMKTFPGHIYELNFSRLRALIGESHLQNTGRFTNQTFQLQFKINRDLGYLNDLASTPSLKSGYVLHMCYNYNGCYLVGGDGGTTKLVTA
jgi:hypothetical protein